MSHESTSVTSFSKRTVCARVCVVMKKGVCVHVWWDREKGRGIAKVAVWMMFNWSSAQLNEAVNPLSPGCSYSEHHGTGLSRREGCRHITVAHTHTRTHYFCLLQGIKYNPYHQQQPTQRIEDIYTEHRAPSHINQTQRALPLLRLRIHTGLTGT